MLRAVESGRYTIDEVDAITGRAIGRPASATFRTMDIAGLDVLGHVLRNLEDRLPSAERSRVVPHPGAAGPAAGGRRARREGRPGLLRAPQGRRRRLLDLHARPGQRSTTCRSASQSFPSIEAGRAIDDAGARVRTLFLGKDRVGEFLRETLAPTLVYAARVAPDIAHSIDDVDRVMRWGFGWELGPFELLDAIGIREVLDAAARGRHRRRPLLADALAAGRNRLREARCRRPARRSSCCARRKASRRGRRDEPGRQPRRPRRRRAVRRVPLEDERHRRRHHRDAAARRRARRRAATARWSSAARRRTSRPAPT